jgi:Tol biopolymer transport system component/fibronectin type 3 domain-containing protein
MHPARTIRMRAVGSLSAASILAALLAITTLPAHAAASWSTTERVSQASGGGNTDGNSSEASLSWNGRYVAFSSLATNLVTGDSNSKRDVFVRDRQLGVTTRVSTDSSGNQGNDHSRQPVISGNGRYVAFTSAASNLVTDDTNFLEDVFVKDTQTGAIERVSRNSAGDEANMASGSPAISYDGRYVAFTSFATNLVPGDTNGTWDVFVMDRQVGVVKRVSVGSGGLQANGASENPAVSFDSRYVAFETDATNLDSADTTAARDIYLRDLVSDTITRISVPLNPSQAANDASTAPTVSSDGKKVSFVSLASNLVPDDSPGTHDVLVRDVDAGSTSRASLATTADPVEGITLSRAMSYDGKRVAFYSSSPQVVPADSNNFIDVFVRDTEASTTARVSIRSGEQLNDNALNPVISGDGRFVAYATAGIFATAWPDSDGNEDVYLGYSSETEITPEPSPVPLPPFVAGPAPPAPSGLQLVSVSDTTAEISWTDNSSDELYFKVERKPAGGSFAQIARLGANTTSYIDSGLVPGSQYVYRVRASNTEANSAYSNELTVTTTGGSPPAAPTGLVASASSPTSAQLNWTDNASNESSYRIERRKPPAAFNEVASIPANSESYLDTALQPITTYAYRVRAANSAGFSAYSNEVTITTPSPAAPSAPANLTASKIGASSLELTWTDTSSTEDGFRIERSTDGVSYVTAGSVSANTTLFEDAPLEGSKKYFYRVVAFNLGGDSAPSNVVGVTTRPSAVCRLDSVVYTSDAAGGAEIYIRSVDGSYTKRVTTTAIDEDEPVLDADGSQIWYVSAETGYKKLYSVNIDGKGRKVRSNNPSGLFDDFSPAVARAPGGVTKVAFVSNRTGANEVYVMNADGSGLTQLTAFGSGSRLSPTFTPDGTAVAFSSDHAGGSLRIYKVPIGGGTPQELAPDKPGNQVDPTFSSDGSRLAYASDREGGSVQLFVRDLASGSDGSVTSGGSAYKARPRFSPDGSEIFFSALGTMGMDVYRVPSTGGSQSIVVGTAASEKLGDAGSAAPWDSAPSSTYLAEGATAGGFETWILLANPSTSDRRACLTLLTDSGRLRAGVFTIPSGSRVSLNAGTYVSTFFVGAVVESFGGAVPAERAMYSSIPGKVGSHLSKGSPAPSTIWHIAEGATAGEFETWILIANPGSKTATAGVDFLSTGGIVGHSDVSIPPGGRVSLLADSVVPDSFDVATKVTSDEAVVVERATYTSGPTRRGATASPAVSSQSTSWFVAEGATAGGFETWILVSNQGSQPACVAVTILESGGPREIYSQSAPFCLGPLSRRSINLGTFTSTFDVATKVESVAGSDGSITASSPRPVVVERAMYNDHPFLEKGSSSAEAVTKSGLQWLAVEGATAGGFETWILIANPGGSAACAEVRYLTSAGPVDDPRAMPICLAPGTRRSLRANDVVTSFDVAASVKSVAGSEGGITATTPQPIVVERSVYTAAMPVRDANSGPAIRIS